MNITTLYQIFKKCAGGVTTDTRHCPQGSLFVALRGEHFDGNDYAAQALRMGSSYVLVDNPACVPHEGDDRYIVVDNTLNSLQQLANYHRRQLNTPLIAITGTNGKTTTKELMAAVLSQSQCILYTEGNLNNHIGVPLTLLRLRQEHVLGIIEMGASHPGDIRQLVTIAEPNYGIITNVGKAHLEGFGSFEGVLRTKAELYDYLRNASQSTVFIHHDNPYLLSLSNRLNKIYYGSDDNLYVNGRVTGNSPFLTFEWKAGKNGEYHEVTTRLIGAYNFPNALAAVTAGRYFGIKEEKINAALRNYTPQNNRSQLVTTPSNTLIVDAYNANPTSMLAALSNFRDMDMPHKMLILGDMRELGKESADEHRRILAFVNECGFDNVVLVGTSFAAAAADTASASAGTAAAVTYRLYPDTPALIADLRKHKPQGKTILIKGSNSTGLSTVTEEL
ncbi:MAG: UDP-N-acetylmuramoyl-tripeptide--D-alanyl-D-alanine ligase [Prevotellaceae bacterium]|jgi:UDP-N-acetylmuramoyl-tripeptide--D-alanyl-D-alanine ligase|nr:UDP-N-acetylmuramoyl-tripeptide--D-alanyl-D-alanine ligase [Prevotellaceae bacterium]